MIATSLHVTVHRYTCKHPSMHACGNPPWYVQMTDWYRHELKGWRKRDSDTQSTEIGDWRKLAHTYIRTYKTPNPISALHHTVLHERACISQGTTLTALVQGAATWWQRKHTKRPCAHGQETVPQSHPLPLTVDKHSVASKPVGKGKNPTHSPEIE